MPESNRAQHAVGLSLSSLIRLCNLMIFFFMLIVQLVVGAMYRNDCPRQPLIPVYLIVMGAGILMVWCCVKCNIVFFYLVSLFFSCWFIAGNVMIYSIYEPNYNKNATKTAPYCDKTLYLFSFWTTNLTYILLCVNLVCWCCSGQLGGDDDDEARRPLQG